MIAFVILNNKANTEFGGILVAAGLVATVIMLGYAFYKWVIRGERDELHAFLHWVSDKFTALKKKPVS